MTIQIRTIMRLGQLKKGDRVFTEPHPYGWEAPKGWATVYETPRNPEAAEVRLTFPDTGSWGTMVERITKWEPKEKP